MKKNFKRMFAMILSFILGVAPMCVGGSIASAQDTVLVESNDSALIVPGDNAVTANYKVIKFDTDVTEWTTNKDSLQDGLADKDCYVGFNGQSGFSYDSDSDGTLDTLKPVGEYYVDFIYDLGSVYNISDIVIYNYLYEAKFRSSKYKLFISETEDGLFDDESLAYFYENSSPALQQHYSFSGENAKSGQYVALRILDPMADTETFDWRDVRVREFRVYGTDLNSIPLESGWAYKGSYFGMPSEIPFSIGSSSTSSAASGSPISYKRQYKNILSGKDSEIYAYYDSGDSRLITVYGGTSWNRMANDTFDLVDLSYDENGATGEIVFHIENTVTPEYFVWLGREEVDFNVAGFEIYSANSYDDIRTNPTLIASYSKDMADDLVDHQVIAYKFPQDAPTFKYFMVRLKGDNLNSVNGGYRFCELMLFGSEANDRKELLVKQTDNFNVPSLGALTAENIEVYLNGNLSTSINNSEKLQDGDGSYTSEASVSFLFADVEEGETVWHTSGDRTADIVYDYVRTCEINQVLLVNHITKVLRAGHYQIYAAEEKESLFQADSLIVDYENKSGAQTQIVTPAEPVKARYLAIRYINPLLKNDDSWAANAYPRIYEFRAYGVALGEPEDLIVPEFDAEYAVSFNNFEGVSSYDSAAFPINHTGDLSYGKAFAVNALSNWNAYTPRSSVTYSWNNNSYVMFGEPLEIGKSYVLSYTYKSVPDGRDGGYAFSLAPQHEQFSNGTGDFTNYPLYYADGEWHNVSLGFTASTDKLDLKVNNCGLNLKSYIDNMLIMKAAEIRIDDNSGTTAICEPSDNIITADKSKNGIDLIVMGEPASFKINAREGIIITSVKHGEATILPDENGFYNIEKVTADITVYTELFKEGIENSFKMDEGKLYVKYGTSYQNIASKAGVNFTFLKAERNGIALSSDERIEGGDILKLVNGDETIAQYTLGIIGDRNNDGLLSVTDVVAAANIVLSSENNQESIHDMDGNGIYTVTDVIYMRKQILNDIKLTPDSEVIASMSAFMNDIIESSGAGISAQDIENGVYNLGNRELIARAMRKAINGEDVTIACIGGSITEGGCSWAQTNAINSSFGTENNNFCDWICRWWDEQFGKYGGSVIKVNAGISATDTVLGIHRLKEDVLSYNPDIVIMEYAVNDTPELKYKQGSYEAMIRELIDNEIGTVMLTLCVSAGYSSEELHQPISDAYNLPMVSFKSAYFSNPLFRDFYADGTHQNIVGHPLAAALVLNIFQKTYEDIDKIAEYEGELSDYCVNTDAPYYKKGYIANISDIVAGKVEGLELVSLGSFELETEEKTFGYRKYIGATAKYSESYEPMVIKAQSCQSLFALMLRSNKIADGRFAIEVNGKLYEDDTFTCSTGAAVDNIQPESIYHWCSANAYRSKTEDEVIIKIYPTNKDANSRVTLYSLLIA